MRFTEFDQARVAVWGAGREARAAFAALRRRDPERPLALLCRADEHAVASQFADARTEIVAGEIDAAQLTRYEVVVRSPGISPYRAPVPEATAAGVRFVTGSAIWFAERPDARVIGVTGTKGKSTTAALIAHLLRGAGVSTALAGNIGLPLLELLRPAREPDWWVVELSSYQLHDLDAVPEIAVFLNLYPEHLDWHAGYANYVADKSRLLGVPGRRPRLSVLGPELPPAFRNVPETGVVYFGRAPGFEPDDDGIRRGATRVLGRNAFGLPGRHNALNLCAALSAVDGTGVSLDAALPAVATFRGLPHRQQVLGVRDDITYVDDSISTTPYATLAALAVFRDRPVTVLVGGHDRGLDWQVFGDAMRARPAHAVVTMGANGARIAAALAGLPAGRPALIEAGGLAAALAAARGATPPGGVVLLSPGAPSFGEFRDYVERGRRFAELAGFDPSVSRIEGLGL